MRFRPFPRPGRLSAALSAMSPGHLFALLFAIPSPASGRSGVVDWIVRDFEILMQTHGEITFAYHIHDSSRFDIEEGLGLFGFKIVF